MDDYQQTREFAREMGWWTHEDEEEAHELRLKYDRPDAMPFNFAFWHPFGPHSSEDAESILERKAAEVVRAGWTLWSFQRRRMFDAWHSHLEAMQPAMVLAFCSASGGHDPAESKGGRSVECCRSFRRVGEAKWHEIPSGIRVPHTFRRNVRIASAFIVRRITTPYGPITNSFVQWLRQDGHWRDDFGKDRRPGVPTRGEYLLRPGRVGPMRRFRAILELQPPYLAEVSTMPVDEHRTDPVEPEGPKS